MTEPAHDEPPGEPETPRSADGLPQHTTPTWEVELLISGIAVFAMLQLPGWLDERYFDLAPRLDTAWQQALMYGYVYVRLGALILAVTFVLHLLLRAHWIALVGLDSVYPRGVRWDRVSMGPLQRDVARAKFGNVADAIERADNRATVVFATGVYTAMQTIKPVVIVAVGACLYYLLSLFLDADASGSIVVLLAVSAIVPIVVASLVDRHAGHRLAPGGRLARMFVAIIRGYSRMGFGRGSTPGMLLVASNQGNRRAFAITFLIIVGALALTMYQVDASKDPAQVGSYGLLPTIARDAPGVLRPDHYDDQRGSAHLGTAPFLQSQVATEPYLRLTIPIRPGLHNQALRRACRGAVQAMQSATARATVKQRMDVLDCLAAMHPLRLDGHALAGVHYDLGVDPKAMRPALVAMIDVRALGSGRHELTVGGPSASGPVSDQSDLIPFWR